MILAGLEWISISWCVRGKDNNFALRYFEHFDHWQWRQSAIETINVDQRVGRLVPPADKRLLKQTVNPPSPLPPLAHPQFLLFSPFWSHQWCSHRGAWHQRQRCTHCTEVEPASYFALPIALHWTNMHRVLFKITLQQRRATPVQAQCTNRQLGFTQILSLLQNEHCNGTGWARSYEGPSATFSEEADCTVHCSATLPSSK